MAREDITWEDAWFVGEDQPFEFTIVDSAGVAVDVTGFTIQFELSDVYSGDALFTKSVSLDDPSNGVISWLVDAADTVDIPGDTDYWYTVRRVDSGYATELAWGQARINDVFVNYSAS